MAREQKIVAGGVVVALVVVVIVYLAVETTIFDTALAFIERYGSPSCSLASP